MGRLDERCSRVLTAMLTRLVYIQKFIGIQKHMTEVNECIVVWRVRLIAWRAGRAMAGLPIDKRHGFGDFVGLGSPPQGQAVGQDDPVAVVSRRWFESFDPGGEGFGPCQGPVAVDQEQGLRGRRGRVAAGSSNVPSARIKDSRNASRRCGRRA